jgi:hypothetical protein
VRGRFNQASISVNGYPVAAHRAAVAVAAGDVVSLANGRVRLELQAASAAAPTPVSLALATYCAHLGPAAQQAAAAAAAAAPPPPPADPAAAAVAAAAEAAALQRVFRLAQSQPGAAEAQLAEMAAAAPHLPGPWFVWAQLAAGRRRFWQARDLFRAAHHCCKAILLAAADGGRLSDAGVLVRETGRLSQVGGAAAGWRRDRAGTGQGATSLQRMSPVAQSSPPRPTDACQAPTPTPPAAPAAAPQVLSAWARLEWDLKLFGPARRLWRSAANAALAQPRQAAAASAAPVLHSWASAEYRRDNVRNARIVVAEALRKCPNDAGVSVARRRRRAARKHAPPPLCCTPPLARQLRPWAGFPARSRRLPGISCPPHACWHPASGALHLRTLPQL